MWQQPHAGAGRDRRGGGIRLGRGRTPGCGRCRGACGAPQRCRFRPPDARTGALRAGITAAQPRARPVQVPGLPPVTCIAAGHAHSLAACATGEVGRPRRADAPPRRAHCSSCYYLYAGVCVGVERVGAVRSRARPTGAPREPAPSRTGAPSHSQRQATAAPARVTGLPVCEGGVAKVEGGFGHSAALLRDGRLFLWGFGEEVRRLAHASRRAHSQWRAGAAGARGRALVDRSCAARAPARAGRSSTARDGRGTRPLPHNCRGGVRRSGGYGVAAGGSSARYGVATGGSRAAGGGGATGSGCSVASACPRFDCASQGCA